MSLGEALCNIFPDNFVQDGNCVKDILSFRSKPLTLKKYKEFKGQLIESLLILQKYEIISTNISTFSIYYDDERLKVGGLGSLRSPESTFSIEFSNWRFAPPESTLEYFNWNQYDHETKMRYDIWSLGAVLYYILHKGRIDEPYLLTFCPESPRDYMSIKHVDFSLDPDLELLLELNPVKRPNIEDIYRMKLAKPYHIDIPYTNMELYSWIRESIHEEDLKILHKVEEIYSTYYYGIKDEYNIELLKYIHNLLHFFIDGGDEFDNWGLVKLKYRIF